MWSQALQECGFESSQPQSHQSQGTLLVASEKTGCGTSMTLYQVISCLNTSKATTHSEAVGHIQGAYAWRLANLSCCWTERGVHTSQWGNTNCHSNVTSVQSYALCRGCTGSVWDCPHRSHTGTFFSLALRNPGKVQGEHVHS